MKSLVKISIVSIIAAVGCTALIQAKPSSAVANAVSDDVLQRSVYQTNCARCHGADGKSNTPKGRETDADDLTSDHVKGMSADKIARVIKNGKGDMPGFGKKLSAGQIAALVKYVKSL